MAVAMENQVQPRGSLVISPSTEWSDGVRGQGRGQSRGQGGRQLCKGRGCGGGGANHDLQA